MSEAPQQSAGWFDWVYRLGSTVVETMRATGLWQLKESTQTEEFPEQETGEPPSTSCAPAADEEPPAEEPAAPAKRRRRRRKKKSPAAPPPPPETPTDKTPEPPVAEIESDEGWTTVDRSRTERTPKWYDALPSLTGEVNADICRDIASGRGVHSADHLPDLIDAVGKGEFDREVLARIVLHTINQRNIIARRSRRGVNTHYITRTLPHRTEGTINLSRPIIVVHNTIANPLETSCGTVFPR